MTFSHRGDVHGNDQLMTRFWTEDRIIDDDVQVVDWASQPEERPFSCYQRLSHR